jgi:hypothetical protein
MDRIIKWLLENTVEVYRSGKRFKELEKEHGDLEVKLVRADRLSSSLSYLRERIEKISEEIDSLRVTREEMIANASKRSLSTTDMEKWIQRERTQIEYRVRESLNKQRDARIDQLEEIVFDLTISTVILGDSGIQNTAMFYYNPKNKSVFSTKKAKSMFGIAEGISDKFTFKKMMQQIHPDYRAGLLNELKTNKRLFHYEAETVDGKKLCLTSFDFKYGNRTIGYGVLLYDPKLSLKKVISLGFASDVKYITEIVNRELERVGKVIHGVIYLSPPSLNPNEEY